MVDLPRRVVNRFPIAKPIQIPVIRRVQQILWRINRTDQKGESLRHIGDWLGDSQSGSLNKW
jgi:hypothetical protein